MRTGQTALPISAAASVLRLVRLAAEALRLWNSRRSLRRLEELSDWELFDIGLTREDITIARRAQFPEDPTQQLEQRRRARDRLTMTVRRLP